MPIVSDLTMNAIVERIRPLIPAIRAEGVTRLTLFGSRVRGDHRPDSDLDILVETDPSRRFDLFKVMHLIEDEVGVWPHIMHCSELTPRIRERMADDLVEVF